MSLHCGYSALPNSLSLSIFVLAFINYTNHTPRWFGFDASQGLNEDDRISPAGYDRHGIWKPAYLRIILPTDVVDATFFPVATRALFITDIMIISQTLVANYFKGTLRKEGCHRWRNRNGVCRWFTDGGVCRRRQGVMWRRRWWWWSREGDGVSR